MELKKRSASPLLAVALCFMLVLTGCDNGNLFGSFNDSGDSGDVNSLVSDASIALRNKDYARAIDLYERALIAQPNNSQALVGSASALFGSAGVSFGTLLSNVINQQNNSGISDLGSLIEAGKSGFGTSASIDPTTGVLSGVDLDRLNTVIDCIIFRLTFVVKGLGDGVISARDIAVLMELAIICLLRSVLRPLREAFLNVKNVNGELVYEVDTVAADAFCSNPNNAAFIERVARDAAAAFALVFEAVVLLGQANLNTILDRISDDLSGLNTTLLTVGTLPASCLTAINNAGININNFASEGNNVFTGAVGSDPCNN